MDVNFSFGDTVLIINEKENYRFQGIYLNEMGKSTRFSSEIYRGTQCVAFPVFKEEKVFYNRIVLTEKSYLEFNNLSRRK